MRFVFAIFTATASFACAAGNTPAERASEGLGRPQPPSSVPAATSSVSRRDAGAQASTRGDTALDGEVASLAVPEWAKLVAMGSQHALVQLGSWKVGKSFHALVNASTACIERVWRDEFDDSNVVVLSPAPTDPSPRRDSHGIDVAAARRAIAREAEMWAGAGLLPPSSRGDTAYVQANSKHGSDLVYITRDAGKTFVPTSTAEIARSSDPTLSSDGAWAAWHTFNHLVTFESVAPPHRRRDVAIPVGFNVDSLFVTARGIEFSRSVGWQFAQNGQRTCVDRVELPTGKRRELACVPGTIAHTNAATLSRNERWLALIQDEEKTRREFIYVLDLEAGTVARKHEGNAIYLPLRDDGAVAFEVAVRGPVVVRTVDGQTRAMLEHGDALGFTSSGDLLTIDVDAWPKRACGAFGVLPVPKG